MAYRTRYRKGRRRRTYRKARRRYKPARSANRKINNIWKYLKRTKPEYKYSPNYISTTSPEIASGRFIQSQAYGFAQINSLPIGSAGNQRIGNTINKTTLKLRFSIDLPDNSPYGSLYVRVIVFQVKSGYSRELPIAVPELLTLLQFSDNEYTHISPFVDGVSSSYRIIWDRMRTLNINASNSSWITKKRFRIKDFKWKQQGDSDQYYTVCDNLIFVYIIVRTPVEVSSAITIPVAMTARLIFQDN